MGLEVGESLPLIPSMVVVELAQGPESRRAILDPSLVTSLRTAPESHLGNTMELDLMV